MCVLGYWGGGYGGWVETYLFRALVLWILHVVDCNWVGV